MAGPSEARPPGRVVADAQGGPAVAHLARVPLRVAGIAAFMAVLVAGIGGLATDLGPWYRSLVQPAWKPPDLVFGPVWTLLYTLTAWAGARAWWRAGLSGLAGAAEEGLPAQRLRRRILAAFGLNAVLNVLWSVVFFLLKRPDWALVEIVLLTASVWWLIVLCATVDRLASRLLWPYLAWVLYAATVNAGVIRLNPLPPGTWGGFG